MFGFIFSFLLSSPHVTSQGLTDKQDYATDEYEYNEVDITNIKATDGDRLVGARVAQTSKYPFLVGWNKYGMDNAMACTGSLITPRYVLSAAHCNGLIDQTDGVERTREECVETTARGEDYTIMEGLKLKCKRLKSGDLEIKTEPKGKVWLGVDNVQKNVVRNMRHMSEIKRHIRHQQTYRGGGRYGQYGGYDITLVELDTPMVGYQPACLPRSNFDDIRLNKKDSILAGYGKYLRTNGETCETNRFGEMKFHYCDKQFGEGSFACITDKPPPMAEECDKFFADPDTPDTVPREVEEIRIEQNTKKDSIYCYPKTNPENPQYGWCTTGGNYYNTHNMDASYRGWGFCGKDCYLDTSTIDSGILREKTNVEILPEKECNNFLTRSLEGNVEVRPEIVCVARKEKWKEDLWQETSEGYQAVTSTGSGGSMRYGSEGYVASVGTCQGDSGGPVFVKEGKKYVVTGIVSGGRSPLGECGGINNPVHYTRVKKFTKWILRNIGTEMEKLCWGGNLEPLQDISGRNHSGGLQEALRSDTANPPYLQRMGDSTDRKKSKYPSQSYRSTSYKDNNQISNSRDQRSKSRDRNGSSDKIPNYIRRSSHYNNHSGTTSRPSYMQDALRSDNEYLDIYFSLPLRQL